jgi:uncharacterized protein (TIGR03437 family)
MRTRTLAACLWAVTACAGVPSFSAAGVVNAASFSGDAVAPGEIITILGSELGPAVPVGMQLASDNHHVVTLLAGTRVLFDNIPAPLIFVSSKQVNAVTPLALAGKRSTQVRVEYQGVPSVPVTVSVARTRPGIFALDGTGQGQAAVLHWPDYTVNRAANRAARSSVVMVYATAGGWEASQQVEDGLLAVAPQPFPMPVAATVGDLPATVLYIGSAPGLVTGALQINLLIPDCAPLGDAVPLMLSIDGVRSQPGVTIAVRPASPSGGILLCSPYAPRVGVYRGQMHCHTTNSDGAQDPATVVRAYRDAGYDFIAVTDHNRATADPGVVGILHIPGVEQAPAGKHLNRIGARASLSGSVQEVIDRTVAEGEFVFLNHPNWPGGYPANPNWTDADFANAHAFYGIEVWNSLVAPNSNAEGRIDALLSQQRRLFLIGTDDCHNVDSSACKTGSTWVFADRLDPGEILSNLKSGNFYASNGAGISAITVAGRTITVTTAQPGAIEFITANGRVASSAGKALSASYTATGDELYIRARVTRDSDKKMAWTNPIYVER